MNRITLNLIPVKYSNNQLSGENVFYVDSCGPEINDAALLTSTNFKKIYGDCRKNSNKQTKLIALSKIRAGKRSIYRRYCHMDVTGLKDDKIGLTYDSIRLLMDSSTNTPKQVIVCKSWNFIAYYWNHPFHATRISFRIGSISIILALIALVQNFCC